MFRERRFFSAFTRPSHQTYYDSLGLDPREASRLTPGALKAAYFQKAKTCHPDTALPTESMEQRTKRTKDFQDLSKAYACLSNKEKKDRYDNAGFRDFESMSQEEIIDFLKGMFGKAGVNFGGANASKAARRLLLRGLLKLTILYSAAWVVFSIPMALLVAVYRTFKAVLYKAWHFVIG